jgi:four helix bundle protein
LQRGAGIAQRLLVFAVDSLKLAVRLRKDVVGRHIAAQWIRSATGAGANYEEARAAESRADFVHKVSVAAKEIREACYWIELVSSTRLLDPIPAALLKEGRELSAILGASAARPHSSCPPERRT